MTTLCKFGDCVFSFSSRAREILEMFVATKCCCWYCCCQNEDFFQTNPIAIMWELKPVCMHAGIISAKKAASVKWKIATLHKYLMVLGWKPPSPCKKKEKIPSLNFHIPKRLFATLLWRNQKAHLKWTLQTDQDTVRQMSNSPSLLPRSPNVLHFRAVCHTAGSKRKCQNPPTVVRVSRPPANTHRKAGSQNSDQRGKELWIFGCVDPTSMVITAFCPALPPKQMAKEGIQVHLHDGHSEGICRAQCHHESD